MKRDQRLHGLSSDHHHALVLARRVSAAVETGQADAHEGEHVARQFAEELEPHFLVEEEVLLPALRAAGEVELARRTEEDHGFLRAQLPAVRGGDAAAMAAFAARLVEHVRFEERELFARCERLPAAVLDEVARRRPKAG